MATKREIREKEQYMLSIETPIYKVLGLDRERNACSKLKYYLIQCKKCGTIFSRRGTVIENTLNAVQCSNCRKQRFGKPLNVLEYKMYCFYRSGAQQRNIKWDLTEEEFKSLIKEDCYYCGEKPSRHQSVSYREEYELVNGIDRIDSSKGYSINNCVPCCNTCNIMKNTLPKDVFLNKIAQIYNYSLNNKKQMEKRISFFEFQNVLSVAKLIDPYVRKKQEAETQFNKLIEQAKKLKAQIDAEAAVIQANQKEIDSYESGIVSVLGFHATDLVKKVMVPTGKTSHKTGKPTMEANYLPTSIVTYDEANKQYIVNTEEEVSEELVEESQEEVTEAVEEASTEWA